jgi:hypothetical protein
LLKSWKKVDSIAIPHYFSGIGQASELYQKFIDYVHKVLYDTVGVKSQKHEILITRTMLCTNSSNNEMRNNALLFNYSENMNKMLAKDSAIYQSN